MSDSDSDLSTPANFPPDAEIESGIREVVRAGVNDEGQITVKIARSRTEQALDLPTDFFKNDAKWKVRSAELIKAAAEEFANAETSEEEVEVKAKAKPKANAGTKRKSDDPPKAKPKRRKKSPSVEPEESEAEISAKESKNTKSRTAKPKPKPKTQPKSEETSALSSPPDDDEPEPVAVEQNGKHTLPPQDDSSDLSSVLDDPPPKKKRNSKPKPSSPSKTKPKTQKPSKIPSKPSLPPDEEEIKRLQSWLLKCGVRKLWHRELAAYTTSKEKIKHLKGMLEAVGMTGRFSAEKARQVREGRELAAELEEARRFNEQWGQAGGEDGDKDEDAAPAGKPKRKEAKAEVEEVVKRRPMGLVDFGDSGEDSE